MPRLICDAALEPFLNFGRMPIANGFLAAQDIPHEYFFELAVGFCKACTMVQLIEQSERTARQVFSLPMYPELSEEDQAAVIQAVHDFPAAR